jgi:hypothetical protein
MARKIRNSVLENRTQRLRLPIAKKPVFVRIGLGISIGYRRNQTAGTWVLRVADGRGGARTAAVGFADDHDDADGQKCLDYWQAQDRAKVAARRINGVPGLTASNRSHRGGNLFAVVDRQKSTDRR